MSVQLWSSSGRAAEGQTPLSSAKALLCDMDGTLVDSSAVVESMWASFARDHGMSERFDEIMAYSPGRTGLDTIQRFLPELTAEERGAIYQRFAREEITQTAGRMAEIPGAAAFMTTLIDAGVPLALVTSAPIALMRVRMEEAGVPIPPVVVSAGDVERGKPDPDPYLKAAELLGVPISSCLVLEDAPSGYTSARRAGAQILLVGDGVPEAGSHVPRIADFTGITFTIHERRAGYFAGGDIARGRARVVPGGAIRRRRGQQSCHRTRNMPPSGRECPRTRRKSPSTCAGKRYARRTPPSRALFATPDRMSGGRREKCPARYGVRRVDQWACWPFHRAWPRSRLRREMTSSGTDLGHTAAHSPMFVQPPKPSASCWLSMLTTRARRSG